MFSSSMATERVPATVKWPVHRNGRGFYNPWVDQSAPVPMGEFLRFVWWLLRNRTMPTVPQGHTVDTDDVLTSFTASAPADVVTWLGHAAFLLRLGGVTVLIDPYLSEFASPTSNMGPRRFVRPALSVDRLPPIDLLLISHSHYDHLDDRVVRALPDKERVKVIVPLGLGSFFRKRGYRDVTELDWGEDVEYLGLTVTATPAVHFSSRSLFDRNRTLWTGFALAAGRKRVFYSGDTAYGPVFRDIGRHHGPFDLALVGIGAYEPRSIMRSCHTNPEEAVQLGLDVGARALLGMHWGTIMLTPEPPFEATGRFHRAARSSGYAEDDVWILKIGETRPLDQG